MTHEAIPLVPHHVLRRVRDIFDNVPPQEILLFQEKEGHNCEVTDATIAIVEALKDPEQLVHVLHPGDIIHDRQCSRCTHVRRTDGCDTEAEMIRKGLSPGNYDEQTLQGLEIEPDHVYSMRELMERYIYRIVNLAAVEEIFYTESM